MNKLSFCIQEHASFGVPCEKRNRKVISFVLWPKEIVAFALMRGEGLYRDAASLAGTWWPVVTVDFLPMWHYTHHHSISALVSEILMSVLQTVQKKTKQFTYGQYIFTDCTEDNVQNTHTYTQSIQSQSQSKIHIHILNQSTHNQTLSKS